MELGRNGEPEKCKVELCHMAESGQWKAKNSWRSWAKKEETLASYIAQAQGHWGIGFADVFQKVLAWARSIW